MAKKPFAESPPLRKRYSAEIAGCRALGVEVQIAPAFANTASEAVLRSLSPERFQAVAEATLNHEGQSGLMTLVLTDDESIQDLNREFLGRDRPTDVLAFGAQEESGPFVAAPDARGYLGDVIISYPRACEQAKRLGQPVEEELDLLVVHGVLHLLGYDHATADEKTGMWAKQEAILAELQSPLRHLSRGTVSEGKRYSAD